MIKKYFLFIVLALLQFSCEDRKEIKPLDELYVSKLVQDRENKDLEMKGDSHSPFNIDSIAKFEPLKYYEPSSEFIFKSKLYKNEKQDTIKIFGTRGEERKAVVEGYVLLRFKDKDYKLNIYKSFNSQGQSYHTIWFTDKTTGNETYHVGRYLDFELNPDQQFVYEIDFNRAYNPYCAYSSLYTCPIPTKEDYLDFEITAGEKNFHSELNTELK
jgi:hypothetical protein